MDKKLNPLDGEIDLLGDTVSDIIWKLNPLTGRLELVYSADSYIQKINPFIGDFDMVGGTGASYIIKEATGNGYINLTDAVANHLMELKAYGGTEQSGTPTPDTPINIVCNNGAIKYGAIGKNLLDMADSNIVLGKYINDSGQILDSGLNFYNKKYIAVKPSTTYTRSVSKIARYISIMEYDESRTFIQRTLFDNGSSTLSNQITMTANTKYILLGSNIDSKTMTLTKIHGIDRQIEEGNIATTYEAYVGGIYTEGTTETISSTLSTATAEMLLKIGNVIDEQEILSGAITRKIGIKVLDGTETWSKTAARPNTYVSSQVITDRDISNRTTFCSHFISTDVNDNLENPGYFVVGASTQTISFSLPTSITSGTAFSEWLEDQYMKGIPVIILYVLDTPTTESVAGQTMNIPKGDSTISITASLNNLGLYAKYKATE